MCLPSFSRILFANFVFSLIFAQITVGYILLLVRIYHVYAKSQLSVIRGWIKNIKIFWRSWNSAAMGYWRSWQQIARKSKYLGELNYFTWKIFPSQFLGLVSLNNNNFWKLILELVLFYYTKFAVTLADETLYLHQLLLSYLSVMHRDTYMV